MSNPIELGTPTPIKSPTPAGAEVGGRDRIEDLVEKFEGWLNDNLEIYGAEQVDKLEEMAREMGFVVVDEDFLVKKFGISKSDAEDFLYYIYEWESHIDGSSGGFGLLYLPEMDTYYYVIGDWWRTDKYTVHYEKYTTEELRERINEVVRRGE
jgi:hypothetical protein